MRVFIAIASGAQQHVGSLRACYEMRRREGDDLFMPGRGSRGDITREGLVSAFLDKKEYDAILFLDADQKHPKDLLERLRESMAENNLDMVCAHYYRRSTKPVQSLCYEMGDGTYPFLPMLDPPTEGLHEIAWTGLGCVLIKRKVMEAVQAIMPPGMSPVSIAPMPGVMGDYNTNGSDFHFFHQTRKLGYRLWLDASVESPHATTLWLGHKSARQLMDYTDWANGASKLLAERLKRHGMSPEAFRQRLRIHEARQKGLLQQLEQFKEHGTEGDLQQISKALYIMEGRIKECQAWLKWAEKYPAIERPDQLPTTDNMPAMEELKATNGAVPQRLRGDMYRRLSQEMIDQLPDAAESVVMGGEPQPGD